jgi:hypothetical protein
VLTRAAAPCDKDAMQEQIAIDAEYLTSRLKALLAIPSPTGFTDEAVRYTARRTTHKLPYRLLSATGYPGLEKFGTVSPHRACVRARTRIDLQEISCYDIIWFAGLFHRAARRPRRYARCRSLGRLVHLMFLLTKEFP